MKDEIKEILRNCEKAINDASGYNDTTDKIIHYITNLEKSQETLIKNDNEIITNLQEENEKLKSYIKLTDEDAKEYMYDTNKEIDRLNNIIEEKNYLYNKLSTESEYAINKLNNIIEELEKEMKREDLSYIETQYVLDKLQELKEGK